jgi:NAD(P)H-hydrate epimerase
MKIAELNAEMLGVSAFSLMERAGEATADIIERRLGGVAGGRAVILCGRGNNGGDGIALGASLVERDMSVTAVFVNGEPSSETALQCFDKYCVQHKTFTRMNYRGREHVVRDLLAEADIICECVCGTGFRGSQIEPYLSELFSYVRFECVNALRLSIDLPCGVTTNDGQIVRGAFQPDLVVSLGGVKLGALSHRAFQFCGEILYADIGIPAECYTEYAALFTTDEVLDWFPKRTVASHKGTFGRLLNIAGSVNYPGAAVLSTKGALRSGVGVMVLCSAPSVLAAAAVSTPEAVQLPILQNGKFSTDNQLELTEQLDKATAVSIGCGLGTSATAKRVVNFVLKNAKTPIILDADGINLVSDNINSLKNGKPLLLTPHPGEFSRLTGLGIEDIQADRVGHARRFAMKHGVHLLLKGARTVIAAADGRAAVVSSGCAALARGGSGDVLTGIIGALAAGGVPLFEAAMLGAHVHGLAADKLTEQLSSFGVLPSDVAEFLPFIRAGL